MLSFRGFVCLVTAALVSGPLTGCRPQGPQTYPVSGTVTFDGTAVTQGDILFIPENRSLAPDATKINDGAFDGRAKEGVCRVEITALNIGPDTPVMMGSHLAENFIPERYNVDSELSITVSPQQGNEYTFELESP